MLLLLMRLIRFNGGREDGVWCSNIISFSWKSKFEIVEIRVK